MPVRILTINYFVLDQTMNGDSLSPVQWHILLQS